MFAPAGTPAPVVARLHDEFVKTRKVDTVEERLAAVGLAVVAGTPAGSLPKLYAAASRSAAN